MDDFDTDFDADLDRTDDDCFEVERDDYADFDDCDPGDMDGDHESALESAFGPAEDAYLDAAFEDRYEMDMGDY